MIGLFVMFSIGLVSANVEIRGTVYNETNVPTGGIIVTIECDDETPQETLSKGDGTYSTDFIGTDYCNTYIASVVLPYHVNFIDFPDGSADPIITLIGANPQIINQGEAYVELGATANDDVDGNLTLGISINSASVDTSILGSYNVIYSVTDSDGNIATKTRVVNVVDATAPIVTLTSPTSWTSSSTVEFIFEATDDIGVVSCNLIVNENPYVVTLSSTSPQTVSVPLANGDYIWWAECMDSAGNPGTSGNSPLNVNYIPSSSSSGGSSSGGLSSGGSSSGGGTGGYCITPWTCSSWSDCSVEGTQTRECSYPSNFCKPKEEKPIESQTCTYIAPTLKEDNNGTSFLTGAVTGIGNFLKSGFGIAVLVGLLIIGGSVIFFTAKKKGKKDEKEDKE